MNALMDTSGKQITDFIYSFIWPLSEDLFKVTKTNPEPIGIYHDGVIDSKGNVILPTKYFLWPLESNYYVVGIELDDK